MGPPDAETFRACHLLVSTLTDPKRGKAQKQATKSVCLLLKNKQVNRMAVLTSQVQNIVTHTFFGQQNNLVVDKDAETRQLQCLRFLAAGFQIMPENICCTMATQITKLVAMHTETGESAVSNQIKTTAYLTLEVLYASRRTISQGDHINSILRQLFDHMELPEVQEIGVVD